MSGKLHFCGIDKVRGRGDGRVLAAILEVVARKQGCIVQGVVVRETS